MYRFGLRTIFVAVSFAAIIAAHISWHQRLLHREKALLAARPVSYGYADSDSAQSDHRFDASASPCGLPHPLCGLMGGTRHHIVYLAPWGGFPSKHIRELPKFKNLRLLSISFDIEKYEQALSEMNQLHAVDMGHTNATDKTVAALANNSFLRRLILTGTEVSDQSIATIAQFGELECLVIRETKVTDDGYIRIKQLLPNCRVER